MGMFRLVTLSPEWEEAPSYISELVRSGVVASIGHTKATSAQITDAITAGATMSTHLGNGAHSTLPKTQNYIWDQLAADGLTPSFILDGIHIPSHFFAAAIRAKGVERSVLVTDAVMPAMCDPGLYSLGQVEVELRRDEALYCAEVRGLPARVSGWITPSATRFDWEAFRYVKLSPWRPSILRARHELPDVSAVSLRREGRFCTVSMG